jgi:hypothetical protein
MARQYNQVRSKKSEVRRLSAIGYRPSVIGRFGVITQDDCFAALDRA